MPVRRPHVVARLARERPRDHAPDRVLAGEDLARCAASLVELLERDRVLVRRDLEDRVGGRVDDPLTRLLVLLPELLDDLRPRRGLVADHAAGCRVHKRVDHVVREAVRVRRKRLRRDDAHVLPVAGRRVLALRAREQTAGDGRRAGLRRAAFELLDVAEPEAPPSSEGRARRRRARRSRACRTPRRRTRRRRATRRRRRRRERLRKLWAWGYSRSALSDALGLILFIVYCLGIVGVAAGVTWIVVRYTPSRNKT